ncbi:Na+/H+ antiporter NhaC family protein [Lignipirellula cremea]|uniref:Malate-2H(+)/Na(+)-lactate antiporter n=1 Tax=Lignipirellula cremea TaxID=2528010 RepID=A0A518DQY5_9BACT|nr:Na+/H+ antiporter NhaC family protein [Lignipirellula cremea]QDU94234.1 Malate-2H(+)/Na(+)-lactate antiporter [Lignipirellula cremea]
MPEHPFGWLSLAPPVIAIVLAMATRRVVVSLLAGVFAGSLILAHGNPILAVGDTLQNQLWVTLTSESKLYVAAFTLLMGAMVGVMNRCGSMRGLVDQVSVLARGRRSGQFIAWVLGLLVFFDDYANTILLGGTLRPLCDRLKISREKLAYLVDSTAAPVAGLALVSTWVAGEIGFVADGLAKLPGDQEWKPLEVFVGSIWYRFYVLYALLIVPMIGLLGRDFGPMLRAEQKAIGAAAAAPGEPESASDLAADELVQEDPTAPGPGVTSHWINAAAPVATTVAVIVYFLYASGRTAFPADASPSWMEIFGEANPNAALLWGALSGLLMATVLTLGQRLLSLAQLSSAAGAGASLMLPALLILWLASTLSVMTGNEPIRSVQEQETLAVSQVKAVALADAAHQTSLADTVGQLQAQGFDARQIGLGLKAAERDLSALPAAVDGKPEHQTLLLAAGLSPGEAEAGNAAAGTTGSSAGDPQASLAVLYPHRGMRLYTGDFLGGMLSGQLSPALLPTFIFLLAAVVAFATGTSWGTMGIIMPLAIPLTYAAIAGQREVLVDDPILLASIGSVLAGAIFGDHCSPISDTTVLSSQASGCHHIAHVWTQLPYALATAAVAVFCGTLPIGFGVPSAILLPLGAVTLLAIVWFFGKRADESSAEPL